jgi:hypothetical protein
MSNDPFAWAGGLIPVHQDSMLLRACQIRRPETVRKGKSSWTVEKVHYLCLAYKPVPVSVVRSPTAEIRSPEDRKLNAMYEP